MMVTMTMMMLMMMVRMRMMLMMTMMRQWSLLLGYSGWWSVEGSLITPLGGLMLLYLYSATFCICAISYFYLSHHTPRTQRIAYQQNIVAQGSIVA